MGNSTAARLAAGRAVDESTFLDLLDAAVLDVSFEPDGWLRVTFDRDLTNTEAAAARRRISSVNATDEKVRAQAETFLATNEPNRAQIEAQVKLLTRLALGLTEQPPTT